MNILRVLVTFSFLAATALPSHATDAVVPNSGGTGSVVCGYLLLLASHSIADRCAGPLDAEHEARFQRMRADYEKFIRENAKADPEQTISKANAMATPKDGAACRPEDRQWLGFWEQNTTLAGEMHLQEYLKTPQDPNVGGCI